MLSNPVSTLDRRIQMRGNRPWLIWSGYLLFLSALTLAVYEGIFGASSRSLSNIQGELVGFAIMIQNSVISLVLLISVSVTASSVAIERQRRMIDLVEVAPVSPVKFLFGKLLSSIRLCVLLLALALPFFATGYMYGGATLSDILVVFLHIICNVLVVCSISLAVSSPLSRPITAIMVSFLASGIYQIIVGSLSGIVVAMGTGRPVPPLAGLSAFSAMDVAQMPTELFGLKIPVWPITILATAVISGLLILGSASAVTRYGSVETKRFRIAILVTWAVICAVFATTPSMLQPDVVNIAMVLFCFFLTFAIPLFSTFETLGEKRNRYEGTFKPKLLFYASSASALPFLILFAAPPIIILFLAAYLNRGTDMYVFISRAIYATGVIALAFSTTRLVSSIVKRIAPARLLSFLAWVVFWIGVPIVVSTASSINSYAGYSASWVDLLNPFTMLVANTGSGAYPQVGWLGLLLGVIMIVISVGFVRFSVHNMEKAK